MFYRHHLVYVTQSGQFVVIGWYPRRLIRNFHKYLSRIARDSERSSAEIQVTIRAEIEGVFDRNKGSSFALILVTHKSTHAQNHRLDGRTCALDIRAFHNNKIFLKHNRVILFIPLMLWGHQALVARCEALLVFDNTKFHSSHYFSVLKIKCQRFLPLIN